VAVDGEIRQLVEVKLNVVTPNNLEQTTTKLLTNPEKLNDINSVDLSATGGWRREVIPRRVRSFLGPGAGEGLAGGPWVWCQTGPRYWSWHLRCRSGQAVSGVSAGRQCHHAQEGHRPGTGYIEAHHWDARRQDLCRVTAGARFDLHFLAPGYSRAAGGGRMTKRILVVEDQPTSKSPRPRTAMRRLRQSRNSDPIPSWWTSSYRSWTVTKRRAASKPTLRWAESQSSQSRLMRSAVKDRRREWPAAMITFRSPSAHVSCWRRFINIRPEATPILIFASALRARRPNC